MNGYVTLATSKDMKVNLIEKAILSKMDSKMPLRLAPLRSATFPAHDEVPCLMHLKVFSSDSEQHSKMGTYK